MDTEIFDSGFDELEQLLSEMEKKADNVIPVLEAGVKEFVNDARRLPKPRSQISKGGYTHLIDTMTYKVRRNEIETGWGKYYGPMVERGTVKMNARPHVAPLFERNKEKYYKKMIEKILN